MEEMSSSDLFNTDLVWDGKDERGRYTITHRDNGILFKLIKQDDYL